MKRLSHLLAVILAVVFATSASYSASAQVALTADACINSTRTTTNFGTLSNLYVGNGNTCLLQFDLSTLPAGITANQVARAVLTVYVNRVNTAGALSVVPVLTPWTESAVTFATAPLTGSSGPSLAVANAGSYVTVDVTALVQGWVTTPANNFGFAMSSNAANVLLDSKENDETGHAARLDVTITSMGATGSAGPVGPAGLTGATGAVGPTGPIGPMGLTGATGATGPQGPVGMMGATGAAGANGVEGATGPVGPAGPIGPTGAIGPQGLPGEVGLKGDKGDKGDQGEPGLQGLKGDTGDAGSKGDTGATGSLIAVLNWDGVTDFQLGQVVFCAACSTNGSSYIATKEGANLDPPTNSNAWQLIAQAGAAGPQGAKGDTGLQGLPGDPGLPGLKGDRGDQGAPGTQGVQGDAGAQGLKGDKGDQGDPGLQGLKGDTGDTGPKGDTGDTGATGSLTIAVNWDGVTDFQIGQVVFCAACSANGSSYIATKQSTNVDPPSNSDAWQLIAQAGAAGPQGAKGDTGLQGLPGDPGLPGLKGDNGDQGNPGLQGLKGDKGDQGDAGQKGDTGATGSLTAVVNWDGVTTFQIGQVVFCATNCSVNGSSYIATSIASNVDPPTNPAFWQMIAQAGATGPQGNQGPQGDQGPQGLQGAAGTNGSGSGTVTSVAAGTITTGGTAGSVTINNGTAAPTIDVTFPLVSIYGDGSDSTADGVCAISSDTNWVLTPPTTDIQCSSFSVSSGATLTVPTGTVIRSTGTVQIDGAIVVQAGAAQGLYLAPSETYSAALLAASPTALPASAGGLALPTFSQRKILMPGVFGGGNGGFASAVSSAYGKGGGSLVILAHDSLTISVSGTITANGSDGGAEVSGASDGGGGGGILILASATSVTNAGTLTANGGQGGSGANYGAGGGGGGIIHLFAPSAPNVTGTENVAGGAAGSSTTGTAMCAGGGSSGGNGGMSAYVNQGNQQVVSASAGSAGNMFTTVVADPATLFVQ